MRAYVLKGAVEVGLRSIWFTAQSAYKRGAHLDLIYINSVCMLTEKGKGKQPVCVYSLYHTVQINFT